MTFDLLGIMLVSTAIKVRDFHGCLCDCSGAFRTCLSIHSAIHSSNNYSLSRVTFNHASVCIYECVRMNVCVCLCMHELVCVYVMISGVIIGVDSEEINSVRVSICWTAREDSRSTHTHTHTHTHNTSLCLSRHFHNRPVPLWSVCEVAFVPALIAFHGVVDVCQRVCVWVAFYAISRV